MTPADLARIIAEGETLCVEFKGEANGNVSDNELVEAVVCLANRPTGEPAWLLVGVEDDGSVTGLRSRVRTPVAQVAALIAARTRQSLAVSASLMQVGTGPVLVIEVPSTATPVGTNKGVFLRRAINTKGRPECLPLAFHEMQSLASSKASLDFCAVAMPDLTWDDLDPLEFERFRGSVRKRRGRSDDALADLSDLDVAKALGAVDANGDVRAIRVLGLLLFGREEVLREALPAHAVGIQAFRGTDVLANDFVSWPLLRTMDELEARWRAWNRETEVMVGMLRVGIPDVPEIAFREAAANALVHRDYTRLAAIHVQWSEERLEIVSPGGLPNGVRLDNILVTAPRPRSPLLADAFKRAGLVERTGRGIDLIFREQLRNGRPAPSYDRTTESDVSVVLPRGEANLDFVRLLTEEEADRALTLEELLLLNALWEDRTFSTADAANRLQRPEGDAARALTALTERGLVEPRGQTKGRTWHLSAATYRRLGTPAAYVRQRGFEAIQQEQMVLQFVERHGRIRNADVVELCRLTRDQAYRLLRRMVVDGRLVQHGKRKGAWYARGV